MRLAERKCPKWLIEATILTSTAVPLEVLRKPKTTKNLEIISFTITYHPNNSNAFL